VRCIIVCSVNPDDRFEEATKENNFSSAAIEINKESGTVKVLELEPSEIPLFEHIHLEQQLLL